MDATCLAGVPVSAVRCARWVRRSERDTGELADSQCGIQRANVCGRKEGAQRPRLVMAIPRCSRNRSGFPRIRVFAWNHFRPSRHRTGCLHAGRHASIQLRYLQRSGIRVAIHLVAANTADVRAEGTGDKHCTAPKDSNASLSAPERGPSGLGCRESRANQTMKIRC
jgi:hypothetical protein